ncbi:MAG: hypothetical protein M3R51_07180 [Candidatus Eremiobacteraeota bacterium]|nr:hypothetical protein [Candidatus Eremiobacteraeota bacterium]
MQIINELLRLPSPAPRPQPVAFEGDALWIGAWDTHRIYAIDPAKWTVREEAPAPGKPFGMTVIGDELRVLVAIDDDDRYIYRFVPGHGFKSEGRIPCPELTGSHLAYDGDTLFVSQNANKRIVALDGSGSELHEIPLARRPLGMTVVDGCFYLLCGDDENEDARLTRVDARGSNPETTELASVPFAARGLAFDGTRFWTNHRDNNEIVAFSYLT